MKLIILSAIFFLGLITAPVLADCFSAQPTGCYGLAHLCHPDAVRATTIEASNGATVYIYDENGVLIDHNTVYCGDPVGTQGPGDDGKCNPDLIGTAGWFAFCDPWQH